MAYWRFTDQGKKHWLRAGDTTYGGVFDFLANSLARGDTRNVEGLQALTSDASQSTLFRVALAGSGSNIGPSTVLFSGVTNVLGSSPAAQAGGAGTSSVPWMAVSVEIPAG